MDTFNLTLLLIAVCAFALMIFFGWKGGNMHIKTKNGGYYPVKVLLYMGTNLLLFLIGGGPFCIFLLNITEGMMNSHRLLIVCFSIFAFGFLPLIVWLVVAMTKHPNKPSPPKSRAPIPLNKKHPVSVKKPDVFSYYM